MAGALLMIVAVAWISVTLARFVWVLVSGPDVMVRVQPSAMGAAPVQTNMDFSILSRVTPFRQGAINDPSAAMAGSGPADFEAVEETTLDLRLHGIFTENEDGGHAFISTNGGAQTAYAPGDEIDGTRGVTLDRLLTDSVLLRRDGVLESLTYGRGEGGITTLTAVGSLDPDGMDDQPARPPDSTAAIARVGEDGQQVSQPAPRAASVSGAGSDADGGPATETASLPTIVRRMTRSDLETLAVSIRFEENQATAMGGLYVYPTGNIQTFAKSGLEAGDIVTDVAGLTLNSQADFARLLSELEQQRQVSLTIIRAGQPRNLRVTLID
ncbi:MAG: type II secretion system protein N [Pseudomonadota bacterium]